MIEGSKFGKKILVSECSYSKEILGDYRFAKFLKYDDESEWSKGIIDSLKEYEVRPGSLINNNDWKLVFDVIKKYRWIQKNYRY